MTKRFLFALLIQWTVTNVGVAQHYNHLTLWSRLQVAYPIAERWDLANTIHFRRQNNYLNNQLNLVNRPLLVGGQLLFTYRKPNERLLVHALQATYFVSNQLLGKELDFDAPGNREWRVASGVEFLQNPTTKWQLRERLMQELRFISANDFRPVGRIRGRLQARYELLPIVTLNGVTELLFHNPPVLNGLKPFRFAQFWLGSSLTWRFGEHVSLETGYTFILGRRQTIVEFDNQNVINLHVGIRI